MTKEQQGTKESCRLCGADYVRRPGTVRECSKCRRPARNKQVKTNFKKPPDEWTWPKAVKAVKARSGGRCEVGTDDCTKKAQHVHHTLLKSQGGRNEPAALLHSCLACHNAVHANPALSYERGWLRHAP